MDEGGEKLDKVTTFKLTAVMSAELNAVAEREGCSKDAAIRKLLHWGLLVDAELRALTGVAVTQVAKKLHPVPQPPVSESPRARKRGGSQN